MRMLLGAGAVFLAGAAAALALPQDVGQLRPGPGRGVVPITGAVDANVTNTVNANVTNAPTVNAAQRGDWTIAVSNVPAVRLSPPTFLQAGQAYAFSWQGGAREVLSIREVGADGWVRVQRTGHPTAGESWVNPAMAQMVERTSAR